MVEMNRSSNLCGEIHGKHFGMGIPVHGFNFMAKRMHSVAPTGSMSFLIASVRALGERFFTLVTLEGKQAGLSLAWMLGLALAAAVLVITGWLALLACIVLALVQNDIVGWRWALSIASLLSFAGAGGLVFMVIRRSRNLAFPATRRQLRRILGGGEST
jgi:hypothetical protein